MSAFSNPAQGTREETDAYVQAVLGLLGDQDPQAEGLRTCPGVRGARLLPFDCASQWSSSRVQWGQPQALCQHRGGSIAPILASRAGTFAPVWRFAPPRRDPSNQRDAAQPARVEVGQDAGQRQHAGRHLVGAAM